jgi:uncharacterized protein
MEFEWDLNKAELNWRNHGVSFEAASHVFTDPNRIEEDDPYPHEIRHNVIGFVNGRLLFVVFTMRDAVCRVISARFADRRELRQYHEGA